MKYKTIEQIEKLTKTERNSLILELLEKNIINYIELSELYIISLKKKEKKQRLNILGLALMLSSFVPFNKNKKDKKFIEAKSAYHILKSGVFNTAPIEKKYKEIIKKTGYSEDKNGIPQKIIK